MEPLRVGNVVDIQRRERLGERVRRAAAQADQDPLFTPSGDENQDAIGPLGEGGIALETALGDVSEAASFTSPGRPQCVDGVVDVTGVRKLKQALQVHALDLVGPSGSCRQIQVSAKVPAQPELGYRDTGAFGRPLHWDVAGIGVLAFERLGRGELCPSLVADFVLPERAGAGFDEGLVREKTAVQVEVVVVVPEISVCDSGRARWLGETAKRRGAGVPRLGEVEGEKVVV